MTQPTPTPEFRAALHFFLQSASALLDAVSAQITPDNCTPQNLELLRHTARASTALHRLSAWLSDQPCELAPLVGARRNQLTCLPNTPIASPPPHRNSDRELSRLATT